MPLNKSKGNMYGFVNSTFNIIKGECKLHNCSYCYMKKWGEQKPLHFDEKELKTDLGEGNFIFVGSSIDMFADNVPPEWIEKVLSYCLTYPNNTYLFQTKNPLRFNQFSFRTKDTLCITLETNYSIFDISQAPHPQIRASRFAEIAHLNKMITIEPIINFDLFDFIRLIKLIEPYQCNIGADSMNSNLPEPSPEKIRELIIELKKFTTVFLKPNLKRIYSDVT